MSNTTNRRLVIDLKRIKEEYGKGIYAEPLKDNLHMWQAVIMGAEGTIWDGGCFKLSFEFSKDYPTKPPTVKFISKMFHPNSKSYVFKAN